MSVRSPNIIILAAGIASRMRRSAESSSHAIATHALGLPKAMIPVGGEGRPFLDYLLRNIQDAGYRDVVLVVGDRDDSIQRHVTSDGTERRFPHLAFHFAVQSIPPGRTKPLGTADAVLCALESRPEWRGRHVTVCNSDNIYSVGALTALLSDAHDAALIDYDRDALGFPPERTSAFSVLQKDERGVLVAIIEKPSPEEVARCRDASGRMGVSMNLFRLDVDLTLPILRELPLHPVRQEKELPAAVVRMAQERPGSVVCIPISERVPDLTTLEDVDGVATTLGRETPLK